MFTAHLPTTNLYFINIGVRTLSSYCDAATAGGFDGRASTVMAQLTIRTSDTMATKYEESVYRAKLAEQAERYEGERR